MKGKVQTVLGLIEPEDLGPTLLHEHILVDIRPPHWRTGDMTGYDIPIADRFAIDYGEVDAPGNVILDKVDEAIAEMVAMRRDGGRAVVELSCGGLHPNPEGLAQVSRGADVHIIMGCGWYVNDYQDPANLDRSINSLAEEMIAQIRHGAWGTDIKAGIIGEIGCQSPWLPFEQRVMEAALVAMQETGAALSIHPGRDADQPQQVADFLAARGCNMARVVMSHIDRTIFDHDRLFRLADSGMRLEFDLFGMETTYYKWSDIDMPNDGVRVAWLRSLKERGHLNQIAISQDICFRTRLKHCGGHGYGHVFRNVVPLLLRRGFTQSDVDQILIRTPADILTFI
jgi:phosphotriesterase-related protein